MTSEMTAHVGLESRRRLWSLGLVPITSKSLRFPLGTFSVEKTENWRILIDEQIS